MAKYQVAWLVLNYSCNNKCVWCYADSDPKNKQVMGFSEIKEAISLIARIKPKQFILIGGEPTIHPKFLEILKYADKKGIKPEIVTNGRLLSDKKFFNNCKDHLSKVGISIGGASERTHESVTKVKGSFRQTLQAIRNCVESKIAFNVSMTIGNENINEATELIDLLKKEGVKSMTFNVCTPNFTNYTYIKSIPKFRQLGEKLEVIYEHAKKVKMKVGCMTVLPFCIFKKERIPEFLASKFIRGGCQLYGKDCFVINYDGAVLPCTHWTEAELFNVFKNDKTITALEFEKQWNSQPVNSFFGNVWKYRAGKCKKCDYFGKCFGGCLLFWLNKDPEKEIKGF